jgi:hypothetical protein
VFLVRTIRDGAPLWRGSLVLAVLCALHFSAAFLTPALFVAGWHCRKTRGAGSAIVALFLFSSATVLILWSIGFDILTYASAASYNALPLSEPSSNLVAYSSFSLAHLGDLLNAVLLSSPLALIVLPSLRFRDLWSDGVGIMLLSLSGGALVFLAIANPEIGAFRDWDVLSLPALPLLLLTDTPGPQEIQTIRAL